MNQIVFIAKTNINTDGRILNELRILKEWNKNLKVDLIVFPDKKVTISFDDSIKFFFWLPDGRASLPPSSPFQFQIQFQWEKRH